MARPKKYLLLLPVIAVLIFLTTHSAHASSTKYFDFGPYYNQPQVLGFSFSSLENLPAPKIPDNLMPSPARGITPGSLFYPLERATENLQLTFTFDLVKKEQLRLEFASERLSEAKTLMDQGKTGAASQAINDYSSSLAVSAQALSNLASQGNPSAQVLANKIEEFAAAQAIVTQALSLSYSPVQAENWTSATETTLKALDEVAEVKGEDSLPETISTSIQELKQQGLLSEEESNKLYSLKSRSEVRDELDKLVSSGQFPVSELVKLNTSVTQKYPDVQKVMETNFQVAELRAYQTLPQPTTEVLTEMKRWQENPAGIPPSNDIKPYLWYNRAQELAQEVDLSNFSPDQQAAVVKSYPQIAADNPTYSPPPSPSPSPAATSQPTTDASPSPQASPTPSPTDDYISDSGGALPGQPTYIIKQLGEGLTSALTFDPAAKAKFRMRQAERRLAEANQLSKDPKKASLYESTIKSYRRAMADASTSLKNTKDSQLSEVAKQLEIQAGRHEIIFEKGLLPPTKDPKLISEVIKTTEDAMDRSADVLDRPALPAALSSRLSDLKAQGLILPEEAEDLVNSVSREEVRSKIRKLVELKTFPLADAKKLDETQVFTSPANYHQLVEVRKVEELQNLRSVQTDLAQTPTLRATATNLGQKEVVLTNSIDTSLIKTEDLGGRDDLVKTYQKLASIPRPINGGQFGPEATPGAQIAITPTRADAVLSTCPEGAVFKQSEGCVWADTGKKLNDYDQYKCEGPRQYYSFAARKCVSYDDTVGLRDDVQPICPVGYTWSWQAQSCQTSTGGIFPFPSPSPEPEPIDDKEREERSKQCPEGSSYQAPKGCVWADSGKSVYDSNQYRCGQGQYYSFQQQKCITSPKEGEPYPKDTTPACKEADAYWSWTAGKCVPAVEPVLQDSKDISIPKPFFAAPGSFFYPLKQIGETVSLAVALTPEVKEQVRISQARERLAESYQALEKGKTEDFTKALSNYTAKMQEIYNDLSKSSLSDKTKKSIGEKLAKEAVEQNLILQRIEVLAEDEAASALSAASSVVLVGVDKAADLSGEAPLPDEVKTKIEALPEQMISEEDKKKLLETNSRVEVRLKLGEVAAKGGLSTEDTAFLNEDFEAVDPVVKLKIRELKKLEEVTQTTSQKEQLEEKIEKNEELVTKLTEFQNNFEPGKEVPAEIRPYVRLSRIEEVAQTIRPDIVRLEEFQNRKDIVLAVATLQEEFKPTKETFRRIEEFRRRNPNTALPPDLARIEALSYNLGVRGQAESCFLPTPPFPANTPCPPPGTAIPVSSYYTPYTTTGASYTSAPSTDKDGKPFVYGQGPKSTNPGQCPDGFHWMYDSGGWCMSNSGNYSSSSYTPSGGGGAGYTPYSPYYTAPGAPPVSSYSYNAPSYYGSAPTYYTTNPPAGTVPGTGPQPTSPGQCPSGFHWMPPSSNQPGWCMADGGTYVPSGSSYTTGATTTSSGSYNCGSQPYDPVTKRCKDGACPGGFNWDGSKCVGGSYSGSSYYSPNLNQSSCGPGYYWDGRGCIPTYSGNSSYSGSGGGYSTGSSYQYGCTPGSYWDGSKCVAGSYEGSGWSDSAARSQSWCQPPSGGCGSNSYWDYGSCYCRSSSTYYGGNGPSPSNQCQGLSCGGGAWLDYSTCSCKYSGGSGTSSTGSTITCYPPSAGCPGGWYDYGTCSCKTSSNTYTPTYSGTSGSSSSCTQKTCGSNEWFDWGSCSCRTSSSTSTSGGSSSGSCPSGYHWMSENGGWCMQDGSGGGGSTSTSTSTSTTTSSPAPTTESAPPPSSAPSTESAPPPSSEPAPSSPSP